MFKTLQIDWRVLILSFIPAVVFLILLFRFERDFVDLVLGVAWPSALLILALYFRSELVSLAGRLKRVGTDGAEFEQPQRQLNTEQPLPGTELPPAPGRNAATATAGAGMEDAIAPAFRPLFKKRLEQFRERLPAAVAAFPNMNELDIALAWGAELAAALNLEKSSRFLFRSQLEALEGLRLQRATKEMFRPYYDRAVAAGPSLYSGYDFDRWYTFLISAELISGPDNDVRVTPVGEAVGIYVAQQRYSLIDL